MSLRYHHILEIMQILLTLIRFSCITDLADDILLVMLGIASLYSNDGGLEALNFSLHDRDNASI